MAGRNRDNPESKIIIRNYTLDTTDRDLRIMFEKYGKIEDLFSPKDKLTGKPRGFTFCQYRKREDASDAIRGMHGREINGVKLSVEFTRIPRPSDRDDRGGGRDYDRGRDRNRGGARGRSRSPRDRRRSPPRDRDRRDRDRGMSGYRDAGYRGDDRTGAGYYDSRGVPNPYGPFAGVPGMPPGLAGRNFQGPPGFSGPPRARTGLLEPPGPPMQPPSVGFGFRDHPPPGPGPAAMTQPPSVPPPGPPPSRGGYGGPPPSDDMGYGRGPPPPSEPRGPPLSGRDGGYGIPPPRSSYSGTGGPPPDQYSQSRGYYEDRSYGSDAISRQLGQGATTSSSYGPPPARGGFSDDYDKRGYDSYHSAPPPSSHDTYSQYGSRDSYGGSNYGSRPPLPSGLSSYGNPPPSSNRYQSSNQQPAPSASYGSQGLPGKLASDYSPGGYGSSDSYSYGGSSSGYQSQSSFNSASSNKPMDRYSSGPSPMGPGGGLSSSGGSYGRPSGPTPTRDSGYGASYSRGGGGGGYDSTGYMGSSGGSGYSSGSSYSSQQLPPTGYGPSSSQERRTLLTAPGNTGTSPGGYGQGYEKTGQRY